MKGVPPHDSLREVIDFISRSEERFDRVVITGDIANNGEPIAYRAAKQILGNRCAPSHLVPGNHDNRDALLEIYPEAALGSSASVRFSVVAANWHLIGLDTLEVDQASGRISAGQFDWLSLELAAHANLPTAIFMHHHPLAVGCEWLDAIGLRDAAPFHKLITQSPQVRVICAGHVHLVSEQRLGNAMVLTAPSTCMQFDLRTDSRPIMEQLPPGFRILELKHDGFESKVVRLPELKYPPQID